MMYIFIKQILLFQKLINPERQKEIKQQKGRLIKEREKLKV